MLEVQGQGKKDGHERWESKKHGFVVVGEGSALCYTECKLFKNYKQHVLENKLKIPLSLI